MDLNRVTLIGNVSQEPEQKSLSTGTSVTKLNVATNYSWKDKSGEQKDKVDFHTIVGWNKLGDRMTKYLKTGDRVYLEGRIDHQSYKGKDGSTKYHTDIIADKMIMLGKGKKGKAEDGDDTILVEPF